MNENIIKNIRYYLGVFVKRPLYALLPAALVVAVGISTILSLPRSYYADALIIIDGQAAPTPLITTTVASERLQFIEQRVLARERLLGLIDKFDLFPKVRQTLPNTKLAELMRAHIRIETVTDPNEHYLNSAALRVGFGYETPELARDVTSELVSMIVEENKRSRVSRASETAQFLVREVNDFTQTLKQKEVGWQSYFDANKDALPGRMPGVLLEMQDKERELTLLTQDIAQGDQELRLFQAQLKLGADQSNPAGRRQTQIAALEADLAQKSLVYSAAHPEMRSLQQKLASLKADQSAADAETRAASPAVLTPELALIRERLAIAEPRQAARLARRDMLMRRIGELKMVVARAPEVEARMGAIDRERRGFQQNLDDMKTKLETARVGERLEQDEAASQIQVVEAPELPRYPTAPSRTKLGMVVLMIAGLAGCAGVYLGDTLRATIRGSFDLSDVLAGETLVIIPHWTPQAPRKGLFEVKGAAVASDYGVPATG